MFNNVMLPIDLNHEASWEKALPLAIRLCGDNGTLHILGIVHDIGSSVVATYLPPNFEEDALQAMEKDLEGFVADMVPQSLKTEVHVGHGHVSDVIVKTGQKIDADVIVIASHPPNELRTFLVGSNADRVVHHADRPVLVVR